MRKKLLIAGVAAVLLLVFVGGYSFLNTVFPKAEPLKSPEASDILSVTVARNSEDAVTVSDADIEALLQYINNAQPTRQMSVNDYPAVRPYYMIAIQTSAREYCYFVYEDGAQVYLESPYEGIYKVDDQMLEFQ